MVQLHRFLLLFLLVRLDAFTPSFRGGIVSSTSFTARSRPVTIPLLDQTDGDNGPMNTMDGVIELADSTKTPPTTPTAPSAPFLSQGEIDPQALNPDFSDPKQARVIIYIILSLLPVLFLIPLMLGSRELIPLESLPPVPL